MAKSQPDQVKNKHTVGKSFQQKAIAILRRPYTTLVLWVSSILMVAISLVYEIGVARWPQGRWEPQLTTRLNEAQNKTLAISNRWLESDDSTLLHKLWKADQVFDDGPSGISLYLMENDTIKLWIGDAFRCDIHSILVQGDHSSIVELDNKQCLVFCQSNHRGRMAATIVILADNYKTDTYLMDDLNLVFKSNSTDDLAASHLNWSTIQYDNVSFDAAKQPISSKNMGASIIGWCGLIILLTLITCWFRNKTTLKNFNKIWPLFVLTLIALRTAMAVTPFNLTSGCDTTSYFTGYKQYLFSPFDLLVTSIFVLAVSFYFYSVRNKSKIIGSPRSKIEKAIFMGFSLTMRSAMLVYFHWALIENIYHEQIHVDLFNLFSTNAPGLLLYFSTAIYIISRLLQCNLQVQTMTVRQHLNEILISLVILVPMFIVLNDQLNGTWWLLVVYSIGFRSLDLLGKKWQSSTLFALSIGITALYFTTLVMWESNAAQRKNAKHYVEWIDQQGQAITQQEPPQFHNYTYAIIDRYHLIIKRGNQTELPLMTPYADRDTTISVNKHTHIVKTRLNDAIVITYQHTTILDWLSTFCYLYLLFFIVVYIVLKPMGLSMLKGKFHARSMAFKIQATLICTVLFLMVTVTIVCSNYSFQNASNGQREVINNKLGMLLNNLNLYESSNPASSTMLIEWYHTAGKSLGYAITLYDTGGRQITNPKKTNSPMLMDNQALTQIKYQQNPFYSVRNNDPANPKVNVYLPAYSKTTLIGYFDVEFNDPLGKSAVYPILEDLLNLFIIILVATLWISLLLNYFVTRPLETLSVALANVSLMRKVPTEPAINTDYEIKNLILQYNRMIDYLEESYRIMAKYERESAWQEMARRVAHEIKNPLTPMRLKIQMLQRFIREGRADVPQQTDATLNLLIEQIDIITDIVQDFHDFAQMREDDPTMINLITVLADVAALYDKYENVDVVFKHDCCQAVWVYADGRQLSRVIVNLCKNSVEALSNSPNGRVEIELTRAGDMATITVTDNGSGISPEVAEHLFAPHFTTKAKGSGLGLVISEQIIKNMSGTISFTSQPNIKTIFTLELPLTHSTVPLPEMDR